MKRTFALILIFVLMLSPTSADSGGVGRIMGNNRYDTAARISRMTFNTSEYVVIASGINYVDALPASTLSNLLRAPILLTEQDHIPEETIDEIKRLNCKSAIILGGHNTVNDSIEKELNSLNMKVERISGANRYETSEMILKEIMKLIKISEIFVSGSVADSVASSPLRGAEIPLVLVSPDSPSSFIKELGVKKTVLGGESTVSKATFEMISASSRIGGANRYETAVALASINMSEHGIRDSLVVNGTEFIDAFTSSCYAFNNALNILLTPGEYMDDFTGAWIKSNRPKLTIVGGYNSISEGAIFDTESCYQRRHRQMKSIKSADKEFKKAYKKKRRQFKIDKSKPMVAITYDDGPSSVATERILDTLRKIGGHATFYVMGAHVGDRPDLVKRAVEEGNEIGNHTYGHPYMTKLTEAELIHELNRCDNAVYEASGVYTKTIRPTFGEVNQLVQNTVTMPLIKWNVDTKDWYSRDPESIEHIIMENISDGAIILMHDTHSTTAEATEKILPKLVDMGYQLVTVSELFHYKGIELQPGSIYRYAD